MPITMLLKLVIVLVVASSVGAEVVPGTQQANAKWSLRGVLTMARNLLQFRVDSDNRWSAADAGNDQYRYYDRRDGPHPSYEQQDNQGWRDQNVDQWASEQRDQWNEGSDQWGPRNTDSEPWSNRDAGFNHRGDGFESQGGLENGGSDEYDARYEQWLRDQESVRNMDTRTAWMDESQHDRMVDQQQDRWDDNVRWADTVVQAAAADKIPAFAGTGYNIAQKGAAKVTVGYSQAAMFRVAAKGGDALPALNSAMAKLAPKGGQLVIEAGEYAMSGQFIITSNNTWVCGAGMDKTILKLVPMAKRFKYAGFMRGMWLKDITVSDLTLDGNKLKQGKPTGDEEQNYGRYGFYADGYDNMLLTRMKIQMMQSYGFDPHGIKPNPWIWSTRLSVTNCVSMNNGWDGFTLDQTLGIYAANNVADSNGRHGFNIVTGSRNVLLLNNKAINNGHGPNVYKSGNGCGYVVNDDFNVDTGSTTIKNCVAQRNFKAAVCLLGPRNVTITGNTFETASYCAHFTNVKTKAISWQNNKCVATGGSSSQGANAGAGFFVGKEVDRKQIVGIDGAVTDLTDRDRFDYYGK